MGEIQKSGQKPPPKFLSYREAMAQYEELSSAVRDLCEALLEGDPRPNVRASLLALQAALAGKSSDG